jgi:hypothetical protein
MNELIISRMGKASEKSVEITAENIELVYDSTIVMAGVAYLLKIQPKFIMLKDNRGIIASRDTVLEIGMALKAHLQPQVVQAPASPFNIGG